MKTIEGCVMSLTRGRAKQPIILRQQRGSVTLSFRAIVARIRDEETLLNKNNPVSNAKLMQRIAEYAPSTICAHKTYGEVHLVVTAGEQRMWSASLERSIRNRLGISKESTRFQVVTA